MKATIAVLPGDGIGPEVMNQAIAALDKIAGKFYRMYERSIQTKNPAVPSPLLTVIKKYKKIAKTVKK